ncbi:hypothetical protein OV090_34575 [Nannocystis sp. RBIL2]|uniref:hypothetical protein n=1 Tax=Nannocystis sp. RBIL2 TaxID=2996788 RepID=UPI00226F3FE1|nr:hypothetical protein [Nannocystis sp. RBIL2]MCY1069919.1 hypothetical protein [Nannocystis sp. RBIL2]
MHYFVRTALLLAVLGAPNPARADDDDEYQIGNNHGRIDLIHLDSAVQGRGPCVQMKPSIPGKSAWACLWRNNPLYPELLGLLQSAFIAGKRCIVYWSAVDNKSHKTIDRVECWRT